MNATRFPLPPLPQPRYRFDEIPSAARDLEGSTIHYVDDRKVWQECLGEMVLLCKEAMRRRGGTNKSGSKPLSLEYLADRSDVDEPLWGYMVRHQGRLQGFVTVTTFTNYHRSFRWDSLHPAAFDDEDEDEEKQERVVDTSGRLAAELEATCRAGDIWQEGIVWPRVAEISLLGGLGCGRVLLELVLEDLARLKPTAAAHYDYAVLQATDNSISFYEKRGFIRVGALSTEAAVAAANGWSSPARRHRQTDDNLDWGTPTKKQNKSKKDDDDDDEPSEIIVAPASESYITKKAGESPAKIAQSLRVSAYDIVFLNQRKYPDMTIASRLKANTVLTVPKIVAALNSRQRPSVELEWFTAKENDTPRTIARQTGVPCAQIVAANKARLPGLTSSARLKQGTKVRIVKDGDGTCWQAYSHWAFPDDDFEEGEPSYMMALKLNKPARGKTVTRPVLESLAVEITPYEKNTTLFQDVVAPTAAVAPASVSTIPEPETVQDSLITETIPPAPIPPKRPSGAFFIFCNEMRERKGDLLKGKNAAQATRILKDAYELLSDSEKQSFMDRSTKQRQEYQVAKAAYDEALSAYQAKYPTANPLPPPTTPAASTTSDNAAFATPSKAAADLFNKVVRLRPGAPRADGPDLDKYKYWYVLTYIPDLQWCHLGPMRIVGTFGSDKPKAEGRPKYKLEDESLGLEVDISSTFCIPVKSRSMRKTNDADKEEWDVRDDGTEPGSRRTSLDSNASMSSFRAATKPSAVMKDRKRKRPIADQSLFCSPLEAVRPDTQQTVKVFIRQKGPGRPPKAPKHMRIVGTTLDPPPSPRRPSNSSSTTTTTTVVNDDLSSSDNDDAGNTLTSTTPHRPKRLSVPGFLGDSPMSPCVRNQPARGKDPAIY